MKELVIIDNGHGIGTPGKCSPDGRLREWQWTRELARRLAKALADRGVESILLVEEDSDEPLRERCRRANAITAREPGAILVSLHSNASAMGNTWGSASGWSAFVAPNASSGSRELAAALFRRAREAGILGNRRTPTAGYNVESLAICRDTHCPAVLTENMFHDNRSDVEFMLGENGKSILTAIHADAIRDFFNSRR